jgi:hypothetical protein
MLPCASQLSLQLGTWMLVTTFRSPATISALADSIPGSKFLACHFASQPAGSSARSALLLHYRIRFAPFPAASLLLARCSLTDSLDRLRFLPPLPLGTFASLRIKAFDRICRLSARLPNPPDFLSLPAAVFYY